MNFDRRYNRLVMPHSRVPLTDYGCKGVGTHAHQGYIKCKLAHGLGYSVFLPDVLFLGPAGTKWIQPLSFGPPSLAKVDDQISCIISLDVSCGHRLTVQFTNRELVARLPDGADLYRCSILGPGDLDEYATGESTFSPVNIPYLRLYHHTASSTKRKIELSGELWGSKWNIQGTHKKLKNVAYVYFTSLDKVENADDLRMIAMATDGTLSFVVDNFCPPTFLYPGWQEAYKSQILVLPVYRASTADRTATLQFDIESSLLAPQHLLRHSPKGDAVWYEIATPFVQRVGIDPESTLRFTSPRIDFASVKAKRFEYVVVGDATTVAGLTAPFDEEDTTFLLKIERPSVGSNILNFWFQNGNLDLFSAKLVETQAFE